MCTEELPSSLAVLSEVSLAPPVRSHTSPPRLEATPRARDFLKEEPQTIEAISQLETEDVDAGLIDRWQEPPNSHWLMEQLRAFQEHPEVLSHSLLESQDTYVTINQNSQHAQGEVQRDDSFEELLPLQVLFDSKGSSLMAASDSDISSFPQSSGSGRLSSQSSLEYPNHTWPPKGPGYTYMAMADSGVSMDYSPMSFSRITEMGNGTIYANEYKNDIPGHKRPLTAQPIHSGYWSKTFLENKTVTTSKPTLKNYFQACPLGRHAKDKILCAHGDGNGVQTRVSSLLPSETFR